MTINYEKTALHKDQTDLLLLSGEALVLQLGHGLVPALLGGDVLAVGLLHHAALLLLHLGALIPRDCLVPLDQVFVCNNSAIFVFSFLPCLTFLLVDGLALVPDDVSTQRLVLAVLALLLQLRLVDHLALLLLDDAALLGVELLGTLLVSVGGAHLKKSLIL